MSQQVVRFECLIPKAAHDMLRKLAKDYGEDVGAAGARLMGYGYQAWLEFEEGTRRDLAVAQEAVEKAKAEMTAAPADAAED